MAVKFQNDFVGVECDGCQIDLLSLTKQDLTLTEALNFANNYQKPIFCKICSTVPDVIPELLN